LWTRFNQRGTGTSGVFFEYGHEHWVYAEFGVLTDQMSNYQFHNKAYASW